MYSTFDKQMMRRVLNLAKRGQGAVSPNPLVGAVVVGANGKVIGEGWHRHFGGAHGEVDALSRVAGGAAEGGTIYVNLEPCCHFHKTPPCTEAIINSGIKRVVASMQDPYKLVHGKGFNTLRAVGIQVDVGLFEAEAKHLNRGFICSIVDGRAWCTAKFAVSLDGKMADLTGHSKWISGVEARTLAHRLRAEHDGVLVGAGTVQADDPELTVRMVKGINPVRIILSPHRVIPMNGKIALSASEVRTIQIVGEKWDGDVPPAIELVRLPEHSGEIQPLTLLRKLPELGITSLLVEGGAGVLSSFVRAGMFDEIAVAYSPSIIGKGLAPFDSFMPENWENRPRFKASRVKRYGKEVVVTYHPVRLPSLPE